MAIALAPRVYGLDAICAAALQTGGGEDVAHFARRVFGRVAPECAVRALFEKALAEMAQTRKRRRINGVQTGGGLAETSGI